MPSGWVKPNSYKWQIIALRISEPQLRYNEIAWRVGCSYKTVKSICQSNGLALYGPRGRGRAGTRMHNIRALGEAAYHAGLTVREIREIANARHA